LLYSPSDMYHHTCKTDGMAKLIGLPVSLYI